MVNVLKFLTENFDILKMTLATFHKFFAECFSIPASLLNALSALTVYYALLPPMLATPLAPTNNKSVNVKVSLQLTRYYAEDKGSSRSAG